MTMEKTLKEALTEMAFHSLGIVPYAFYRKRGEINEALAGLPADEARKMRRKFRKCWRKIAKRLKKPAQRNVGLGETSPTITQKNRRKFVVYQATRDKFVNPTIEKTTECT